MNPQDVLNQNIRLLIGDLQVNLMMAQARVAELEAKVEQLSTTVGVPEVSKPNGRADRAPPLPV